MTIRISNWQQTSEAQNAGSEQPRAETVLHRSIVHDPAQALRVLRDRNQEISKNAPFVPGYVLLAHITGDGDRTSTGCPMAKDSGTENNRNAPQASDAEKMKSGQADRDSEKALTLLEEAEKQKGLSLDLRANPGGASEFGGSTKVPTDGGVGIGQSPRLDLPNHLFITVPTFGKEMGLEPSTKGLGIVPDFPLNGEKKPQQPDCLSNLTS